MRRVAQHGNTSFVATTPRTYAGMEDTLEKEVELRCNGFQRTVIENDVEKQSLMNIVSGPGTGKTKTLCDRIAYLLGQGVKPNEILVFSLTNQAVNDFKRTLAELLGLTLASAVHVTTIHSFANSIVLANSPYWEIVMDKSVNNTTVNRILHSLSLRNKPEYFKYFDISELPMLKKITRAELQQLRAASPDVYKAYLGFEYTGELSDLKTEALIYDKIVYEATQTMFLYNKLHNDATFNLTVPLSVLNAREIIVDEFQDISYILLDFILELSRGKQLTIAGDIDQSLYEFNGATPDYNIKKIIPYYQQEGYKLKEYVLGETYRFPKDIHKMSVHLLGQSNTFIKETVPGPALKVVREEFNSLVDEYEFIYNEINDLISKSNGQLTPKNFAVLSNTNQSLIDLQTFFNNKNTPYQVNKLANILPWMDTKISSLITFLKLLENPENDPCLIASLGMLKNFGPATIWKIKQEAEKEKLSVYEMLNSSHVSKFPRVLKTFVKELRTVTERLDKSDPSSIMYELVNLCRLFSFTEHLEKANVSLELLKNVMLQLSEKLELLHKTQGDDVNLISTFLATYQSEIFKAKDTELQTFEHPDEAITFSTIHSAKGLQWDIVFVMSTLTVTGGNIYSVHSRTNYVAATRAKHLLYFNKSFHDNMLYIDTKDEKLVDQNLITVRYQKTAIDYIPELKVFSVPNNLRSLPPFAAPYGKSNDTERINMLVDNIRKRNMVKTPVVGAGVARTFSKLSRKI